MLAAIGWGILIVTAAKGHVRIYRWICSSLRFSDGTTASFIGDPKRIWFSATALLLIPQADKWISRIIASQVDDSTTESVLILTFLVCLWLAYALLHVRVFRWAVRGVSLSTGTTLSFDGGVLGCFGLTCAFYLFGAFAIPTYGLIMPTVPIFAYWYLRWWIGHVHGGGKRLHFAGSIIETWWRILAAIIYSALILTIPSAIIWLYRWVAGNIRVESERFNNLKGSSTTT